MYDELVKRLRATKAVVFKTKDMTLLGEAADAIEELQKRVPVPPHGRLIDADALMDQDGDVWDGVWGYSGVQIANAPTIIPAEEGE